MSEDSPVAKDGGDPHDPFRVDGGAGPPAVGGQPPSGQPPSGGPSRAQPGRRPTGTRLAILAVACLLTAVLAPPVGVVLAIVTIVLAARSGDRAGSATRLLTVAAASAGLVVGIAATALGLLLADEVSEYSRCLSGANTRLARQACQDELTEALVSRLGS